MTATLVLEDLTTWRMQHERSGAPEAAADVGLSLRLDRAGPNAFLGRFLAEVEGWPERLHPFVALWVQRIARVRTHTRASSSISSLARKGAARPCLSKSAFARTSVTFLDLAHLIASFWAPLAPVVARAMSGGAYPPRSPELKDDRLAPGTFAWRPDEEALCGRQGRPGHGARAFPPAARPDNPRR
jgi:hypothetical protein